MMQITDTLTTIHPTIVPTITYVWGDNDVLPIPVLKKGARQK